MNEKDLLNNFNFGTGEKSLNDFLKKHNISLKTLEEIEKDYVSGDGNSKMTRIKIEYINSIEEFKNDLQNIHGIKITIPAFINYCVKQVLTKYNLNKKNSI